MANNYSESDIFDLSEEMTEKFLKELNDDMLKMIKEFSFKTMRHRDESVHKVITKKGIKQPDEVVNTVNEIIHIHPRTGDILLKRSRGRPRKKSILSTLI
jgi:hypothetical protein